MKERFVHLHIHSDQSQLDGGATVERYVRAAAERGNPAIALTDHGTMRGAYELTVQCDKHGLKPIYGIEFYVCLDMNRRGLTDEEKADEIEKAAGNKMVQKLRLKDLETKLGIRKTWHLTAWALDDEGLRNLYRLSSEAWSSGYYYRPRIDIDTLCRHHRGLAIGTGCVGSIVCASKWAGDLDLFNRVFTSLIDTFDDRLYFELMPHALKDNRQAHANEVALNLWEATGRRGLVIATQDAHYLHPGDAAAHDVLLSIGTGGRMEDEDRFTMDGEQYWLKTAEEMAESFEEHHGDLGRSFVDGIMENTAQLAERCTAKIVIDPLKCLLPEVGLPEEFKGDDFGYLRHLAMQGIESRDIGGRAEALAASGGREAGATLSEYSGRLARELLTIRKSNFSRYFLMLHDVFSWARQQGIPTGPGRGSAAGSLVSYLLGITQVDPIQHRLMFERFIAPGRINMPDIDADFCAERRGEILGYLKRKYGEDRVAQIGTMSTMQARQAIKDVARVHGVQAQVVNVATSAVDSDDTDGDPIERAKSNAVFAKFAKEYPKVIWFARALSGLTKTVGVHAAGVVVSPVPLTDVVPLEVRRPSGKEHLVTAFDLRGVEGIGLVKIDVLGLRTVTLLDLIERAVTAKSGESFRFLEVPLDDDKAIKSFTSRDFVGVFQFDSSSAYSICDGLEFERFDDIAVVNSINRPGAYEFADEYKARRIKGGDPTGKYFFHQKVADITRDSLGLMIYQEHVIRVATDVAGMSAEAADKLRKKIGKSEGAAAMESERDAFVSGCAETTPDMKEETAHRLWDAICKFGRYGFNRAHAVCYSMLSYWTMYAKQHWPLEFYWALVRMEKDAKKIQRYARDAENHGVQLLLPDINCSSDKFEIDYDAMAIRGSFIDIENIGGATAAKLVELRRDGKFANLRDFFERKGKVVNKRVFRSLVMAGAFDSLVPNPRWLNENTENVWVMGERSHWDYVENRVAKSAADPQWTYDERMRAASLVNPLALPRHPCVTWESFLAKAVKPPVEEIGDALFATVRNVYCAGLVTEIDQRTVGDTGQHDEPHEEDVRERIGWGQPWARISVEGLSGKAWARLDWRTHRDFGHLVDSGPGFGVLLCAETHPEYANLHVHFLVRLRDFAKKVEAGERLTLWERLFVDHPALTFPWETKAERRLAMSDLNKLAVARNSFRAIGVVSHITERVDKRGGVMSWFGLAGVRSYLSAMCFSSAWEDVRGLIVPGALVSVPLHKTERGTPHLPKDTGKIVVYKKTGGD